MAVLSTPKVRLEWSSHWYSAVEKLVVALIVGPQQLLLKVASVCEWVADDNPHLFDLGVNPIKHEEFAR